MEGGNLQAITHALADAIGTAKVVGGTVMLLGLAQHLSEGWHCPVYHRLGKEQDMD